MLSIALAGAICLAATSVRADPVEPQVIPACKVYKLADGREVCGWLKIEDVRAAYKADAELVKCREVTAAQVVKIDALEKEVFNVRAALALEEGSRTLVVDRNKELTTDLIEMNRKYENERAKPRWGNPIAWTTAAVLGAALVGFVGADLIN
jgi:hypothetical protein